MLDTGFCDRNVTSESKWAVVFMHFEFAVQMLVQNSGTNNASEMNDKASVKLTSPKQKSTSPFADFQKIHFASLSPYMWFCNSVRTMWLQNPTMHILQLSKVFKSPNISLFPSKTQRCIFRSEIFQSYDYSACWHVPHVSKHGQRCTLSHWKSFRRWVLRDRVWKK